MKKEQNLLANGVDPSCVVFDNNVSDGYFIRKNYYRWEIGFRERGAEYYVRGFPSESQAFEQLYNDILKNK